MKWPTGHGNAMLFLAHHSEGDEVFEMLLRAVDRCFEKQTPLKLEDDSQQLDELVEHAPHIAYRESQSESAKHDIVEEDERVSENLEKADKIADRESKEPEIVAMNIVAELNALFKGIEILGMALKADYGDLKSDQKQRYLSTIVDGGLRGLRGFAEIFGESPDYVVALIEEKLLSKMGVPPEKRKQLAKKVVFTVISTIALGFVRKIGGSIGSRNLYPAIKRLVTADKSNAYKLIEVAALLETPGPLPFGKLDALKSDLSNRAFAFSVLRRLALIRVYMYETPQTEKQKLFNILGIKVETQMAIDVKTKDTKKARLNAPTLRAGNDTTQS